MAKIVWCGEAPGKKGKPELPLFPLPEHYTTGRLLKMAGVERGFWMIRAHRINLVAAYPGDKYPHQLARDTARMLSASLLRKRRVVLLGKNTAKAFGVPNIEPCKWVRTDQGVKVAFIPHPSGRNRFYNSKKNQRKVGKFVHSLIMEKP